MNRFAATLSEIGIANDIHIYDDVNHGFWLRVGEERERREPAALNAWERLNAYLTKTLSE